VSPICPGWTQKNWSGRRDSNPRPQPWQCPQAVYATASLFIPEPAKVLLDKAQRADRARGRAQTDRSRREPDIADRGGGRRIWAESAPTGAASGRTGGRAIAVIPSRARTLTKLETGSSNAPTDRQDRPRVEYATATSAGANWSRANEIVMRHRTRELYVSYPPRDKALQPFPSIRSLKKSRCFA
jgi:hypothetical protein